MKKIKILDHFFFNYIMDNLKVYYKLSDIRPKAQKQFLNLYKPSSMKKKLLDKEITFYFNNKKGSYERRKKKYNIVPVMFH